MLPYLTRGGSKTETEKHAGVAITQLTEKLPEDLREPLSAHLKFVKSRQQ